MKRESFKKQRHRVRDLLDYWIPVLGLGWYALDVCYYDSKKQFMKGSDLVVARVWTRWKYMKATIDVCLPVVKTLEDDRLEHAVVHELCHILVNEMRTDSLDLDHEERTVEMMTKAFIWTRNSARLEGKNERTTAG